MSSDRTIVDAIKVAQDLLRQNLTPTHNLTDAATVMRFRELVRSQAIRSALDRSSDTLLTFALREVERVISDQSQTNREYNKSALGHPRRPASEQRVGIPAKLADSVPQVPLLMRAFAVCLLPIGWRVCIAN